MDRAARPRSASLGDFQFGAVATETIEDALLYLARQNEQAVREATGQQGHFRFRETRFVEFVFLLSEQWCLEKSVRYQAVEILERFMVKQAEDICAQAAVQLGDSEWTEAPNWRVRKEWLCSKFVLRLVSCVQLASKLSFHYKIINNVMALHFLQALGYPYTKEELLESELDVLKSLDFQINLSTPLEYVEMLLEVLGYNGCVVPATQLHATCLTLLDLVYLLHGPVYESLLRGEVLFRGGRLHAAGSRGHRGECFHPEPHVLEPGRGPSPQHHWHRCGEHSRVLPCGPDPRCGSQHPGAAACSSWPGGRGTRAAASTPTPAAAGRSHGYHWPQALMFSPGLARAQPLRAWLPSLALVLHQGRSRGGQVCPVSRQAKSVKGLGRGRSVMLVHFCPISCSWLSFNFISRGRQTQR